MLLFLLYILFFELVLVTIVAVALFAALAVAIRKLDNIKKHISVWSIEMHFI